MSIIRGKRLLIYRKSHDLCLICGKKITPKVSKRRFCLECGLIHYGLLFILKRLRFNFWD